MTALKITPGLSFKLLLPLASYPPSAGWTLTGHLAGAKDVQKIAPEKFTPANTGWRLHLTAADTKETPNLDHHRNVLLQIVAALGDEQHLVIEKPIAIAAPLGQTVEPRTNNQIILGQLEAVIRAKSTKDYQSLSVNGRSIQRLSWEEIIAVTRQYRRLVAAERRPHAPLSIRKVKFT